MDRGGRTITVMYSAMSSSPYERLTVPPPGSCSATAVSAAAAATLNGADRVRAEQITVEGVADFAERFAFDQRDRPAVLADYVVDQRADVPVSARGLLIPGVPNARATVVSDR